ncbi:MAG TPA: hypothetical protein VFD01_18295 [Candidatus Dormibacteraeota bacterium]|jgi:hypothetical protein|nr:hypothetical protein [Candidatus Dormibacteraeota bacterium]
MASLLDRPIDPSRAQIETVRPLSSLEAEVLRSCLDRWRSEARDPDGFVWVWLDSLLADLRSPEAGPASARKERIRSAMRSLTLTGLARPMAPCSRSRAWFDVAEVALALVRHLGRVLEVTGLVRRGGAQIDAIGWRLRPGRAIRR